MILKPVIDTIILVEDRIAEILESGDLEIEIDGRGLLSDRHLNAVGKHRFLKELSFNLARFQIGDY